MEVTVNADLDPGSFISDFIHSSPNHSNFISIIKESGIRAMEMVHFSVRFRGDHTPYHNYTICAPAI